MILIGTGAPTIPICCYHNRGKPRPFQIKFDRAPSATELRQAIDEAIPADGYFDDVHGSPASRRHLTYYYAEQIRAELEQRSGGMNFAVNGKSFSAEPAPGSASAPSCASLAFSG